MPRSSLLCIAHRFSVEFQLSVPRSLQLHIIPRFQAHSQRTRAFSRSPNSQRFKLRLSTKHQSEMAPGMTTLKGQPLDRAALDSLLRRRFFFAPTAEIYG